MSRSLSYLILAAAILTSASLAGIAADWPGFRGPNGNGVTEEASFPTKWSAEENVKWRIDMPIRGNESPIVSNGHVFATSAAADGTARRLHCFDRKDGKQLWVKEVPFAEKEKTHQTNPFGAATPAADGENVVVWHGTAGLYCYDFKGTELWKADLGPVGHVWGYGSSPVIHDGLVFLNYGPGEQQFLVAVKLEDGDVAWKVDEPGGNNARAGKMSGSWSTPVIVGSGESTRLVCSMPTRAVALNPKTGDLIWECSGLTGKNGSLVYTSPVIAGEIGIFMGGYTGPAMGVKLGGTGDVTETHRLWHATDKNPQRISSGIVVGDHLFMANAGPGTIQCIEIATGKEVWKARGPGANHWGQMAFANGNLYVTNQKGATVVFEPSVEEFKEVAVNQLDASSNSTPAFSDGEIFLRTAKSLYCIAAE
jgi:outer membrane protein assembly factor BamB